MNILKKELADVGNLKILEQQNAIPSRLRIAFQRPVERSAIENLHLTPNLLQKLKLSQQTTKKGHLVIFDVSINDARFAVYLKTTKKDPTKFSKIEVIGFRPIPRRDARRIKALIAPMCYF